MTSSATTAPLRRPDPARVRDVFDEAADLPPAERAAFVARACGEDDALVAEVMALLGFADLPAGATTDAMPSTIGRFAITGKLGQGGMGVVYRGRDPSLARDVAIKLVTSATTDARARLVREAHAMARVAHPNVVPVYEVGDVGEQVFVAMELVEGATLSAWLRAEKRPWRAIVRHLVDAGRGLAAAHRAGILHRDFKPDNILVGDDGRARVIDFGLARDADRGITADTGSLGDGLTRHGAIAGTPGFMSPEHFTGGLTPLSDQWSFAVTAYVALFGRAPFPGATLAEVRDAVTRASPSIPPLGDLPPGVVDVILRGLRPLPEERFESLDALLERLDELLADPHEEATSRSQRRKLAIGVVALGVINFLAGGLRTDFAFDWSVRGVLVHGAVGIPLLALGALTMRRALWRTAHDRRVMSMMFTVLAALVLHRALLLDADVVHVMRADAVIVISLLVVAAVAIERWFAASAAVMVVYLALSLAVPSVSVPAFGLALIGTLALGIWFWREPVLRAPRS